MIAVALDVVAGIGGTTGKSSITVKLSMVTLIKLGINSGSISVQN